MPRHRFALLLLPSLLTVAGCEIVTGLSDLEKDPDFNPDAETSAPVDTGTIEDSTMVVDSAPTDTGSTTPMDTAMPVDAPMDAPVGCGKPGSKLFGGHCYFPLTTNLSFDEAKAKCVTEGGYLAIVTSSAENTFIATLDNAAERWIGLSKPLADINAKENYKWVDGSAFDATKFDGWAAMEPNNGDAARLRPAEALWYDREGATTTAAGIHAICEKD